MDLAVAATAFLLIVPVELPDKTFIATLVLATRFRALYTWIGVGLAFAVQSLIAVLLGGLLNQLPRTPVAILAMALFAVGAVVLWRGAASADVEEAATEEEFAAKVHSTRVSGLREIAVSFTVLFLAEWGDLSQLLTAGLAARSGDPVSVFVGAWAALLVVSGAAALLGRTVLARMRLSRVHQVGAVVCAILAVLTGLSLLGLDLHI